MLHSPHFNLLRLHYDRVGDVRPQWYINYRSLGSLGGSEESRTGRHRSSTQAFAKSLGAIWAGDSDEAPPELLDAAIIFAPVGALVPLALKAVRKGGKVVCAGIEDDTVPADSSKPGTRRLARRTF